MGNIRIALLGCAMLLGQTVLASAADLDGSPLAPPPNCCGASPWYLKGYMGMTDYHTSGLSSANFATSTFNLLDSTFESSGFFGAGLGYKYNSWLRFDVTSEFRNRATFHGLDRYVDTSLDTGFGTNQYTTTVKSWVTLANMYWDIGCWRGITPYVGGGIGFAENWEVGMQDINEVTTGVAFANTGRKDNFAWDVQAGISYDVTPNFTVDLAYRYLNIGDSTSSKESTYLGGSFPAVGIDNIYSNDVMLSLRYKFGDCCSQPQPVSFK